MRPGSRRGEAIDEDIARRMVSRAERRALEKAEELRSEAEALLKSAAVATVNAESKVLAQFEERLMALRDEMDQVSRRATAAESELELARVELTELKARAAGARIDAPPRTEAHGAGVAPVQAVGAQEGDRLLQSATFAAARLHSQAELDLVRAKEEAVVVLRDATDESRSLLAAAVSAIERHTAITEAVREQAERDSEAAATLRAKAQAALAAVEEESERIRATARAEAKAIAEAAEHQAAEAASDVHRRLADEVVALRDVVDKARSSFESFVAGQAGQTGQTGQTSQKEQADKASPGDQAAVAPGGEARQPQEAK